MDPITQFAERHLGGRAVPSDLRKLVEPQRDAAASSERDFLKSAGVTMLDGDRMPALIAAIVSGRDNLDSANRLAYAQAMGEMLRYCGFVAEGVTGDAIGYWFSPDPIPIDTAPLLRFDTEGHFSILPGNSIAEGILFTGCRGDEQAFGTLRKQLNHMGLDIPAGTISDLRPRECALDPEATYQRLVRTYARDLSTTSLPDTGAPVDLMTMHRGPDIGPGK
jgi:hypothetical protein